MSKVITNILLQEIVPAIEDYSELRKQLICMASHLPTNLNMQPQNSLNNFWRQKSSLSSWGQLKTAAIKLGVRYLNSAIAPNPLVIYALLADCRRIIAKVLHQPYHSILGKPRTQGTLTTALGGPYIVLNNPYADFYPLLKNAFDELPQSEVTTNDDMPCRKHEIVINETLVTSLVYKKAQPGFPDLFIEHCLLDEIRCALFNKHLQIEFKNYMQHTDEALIIESIAKLAYYFTMATPLKRGSAATTEMFSFVLLWNKNIRLEYQGKIVTDLRAYFSGGIEQFASRFKESLVAMDDELVNILLDNQSVSTDDFAWSSEEEDLPASCPMM